VPIPDISLDTAEQRLEGDEKDRFLAFMRKMLQWKPEDRGSCRDILSDEWLLADLIKSGLFAKGGMTADHCPLPTNGSYWLLHGVEPSTTYYIYFYHADCAASFACNEATSSADGGDQFAYDAFSICECLSSDSTKGHANASVRHSTLT
jgi:hypothetical protein